MKFRPCIDIHNGKVKQIVGGSLLDEGGFAQENFVSRQSADFFAALYRDKGLSGGHIILLNPPKSEFYEKTRAQAFAALREFPGGFQVGGGINPETAGEYLDAGASHVIVTSYIFQDGTLYYDRLRELERAVSRERLVLDLSCRKRDSSYYIVTDRWQKYTDVILNEETIERLSRLLRRASGSCRGRGGESHGNRGGGGISSWKELPDSRHLCRRRAFL